MDRRGKEFGKVLREKRTAKGISLRKFAEKVGVSAAYLSQVEQGNVLPPTADRVQRMAEMLGVNPDELIALAGRVPKDLPAIIHEEPTEMPQLLREAKGMTADQLRELREQIRRIKGEGEK